MHAEFFPDIKQGIRQLEMTSMERRRKSLHRAIEICNIWIMQNGGANLCHLTTPSSENSLSEDSQSSIKLKQRDSQTKELKLQAASSSAFFPSQIFSPFLPYSGSESSKDVRQCTQETMGARSGRERDAFVTGMSSLTLVSHIFRTYAAVETIGLLHS